MLEYICNKDSYLTIGGVLKHRKSGDLVKLKEKLTEDDDCFAHVDLVGEPTETPTEKTPADPKTAKKKPKKTAKKKPKKTAKKKK